MTYNHEFCLKKNCDAIDIPMRVLIIFTPVYNKYTSTKSTEIGKSSSQFPYWLGDPLLRTPFYPVLMIRDFFHGFGSGFGSDDLENPGSAQIFLMVVLFSLFISVYT